MFLHILSKRTRLWLPLLLSGMSMLAGCLSDTNPVVQVVPRVVLAPQNPRFQAVSYVPGSSPAAGSMKVLWNRSIADTQLNFKGYRVDLYTAEPDTINQVDTIAKFLASAQIDRIGLSIPDTTYTFTSIPGSPQGVPLGLYGVIVHAIKANDSGTLSSDSSYYAGLFDPLPFSNPTNLQAESAGSNVVKLHWTPSPQENDTGFYRYVIYYRDTTKTPFDTGRAIFLPYKPHAGWNTTVESVTVPAVTLVGQSTSEWPYQFWIKAERNDSTFFYGMDTNSVTWAGAERLPRVGNDTGSNAGYLAVRNGYSVYIGSIGGQFDMEVDSSDNASQFTVSIPGDGTVTLQILNTNSNGIGFLSRIDLDSSLDSVYYSGPLNDPTQFSQKSITITPDMAASGGAIVYLMMNDNTQHLGNEWARIFIRAQQFQQGFVNAHGAVDLKASFQPATSKDGSQHLPYY